MRNLSLDVLRAIAVILVMFAHVGAIQDYPTVLNPLLRGAGGAVDIFFVLSGYLVSGLLFKTPDPKRFLWRRAWKIMPSFWLLIAMTVIPQWNTIDWHRVAVEMAFCSDYLPGLYSHLWSIGVEEKWYWTLPFLMLALRRTNYRLLPFLSVAALVFCLELRCLSMPTSMTADAVHHTMTAFHLRFDGLLLGVALQYAFQNEKYVKFCSRKTGVLIVAGTLLLSPCFVFDFEAIAHLTPVLFTLKAVGSVCLVAAFVAKGVPENWLTKALGCVGKSSYPVYLFHPLPLLLIPLSGWAGVVIYVAASLIIGIQLGRCVEQPMLRLRDYWSGRNSLIGGASWSVEASNSTQPSGAL
jgi:peptidoglycan/LPS O-acetylase OafA/YrhL